MITQRTCGFVDCLYCDHHLSPTPPSHRHYSSRTVHLTRISPFHDMVSSQKRKPDKPARTRKPGRLVSVEIRKNIPFNKNEVVTRTQVARKVKKCVVTKSTKVVVPMAPSAPSKLPDPSPSNHDDPQQPIRGTRKGPSRSVAVCHVFTPLYLTKLTAT